MTARVARPLLALLASLGGCAHEPFKPATAAKGYAPAADDRLALDWVRALAMGDEGALARVSGVPFTFRSTAADRRCESRVTDPSALAPALACLSQREDVRLIARAREAFGPLDVEQGASDEMDGGTIMTLAQFQEMGGSAEGYAAYLRDEPQDTPHTRFESLAREVAPPGRWVRVRIPWLYHVHQFRLHVCDGKVTAVALHLHVFPD